MITEKDLQEAIAECMGERNPNANTCIKLAAYYTIQNELYPKSQTIEIADRGHSFDAPPEIPRIKSESEFATVANNLPVERVWKVMDELMKTLQVVNPRLYAGVMRRLEEGE